MSKHLTIQIDDMTLFSGPVEQYTFSESEAGHVEVKAGPGRTSSRPLLEQLRSASKGHGGNSATGSTNHE